MRSLRTVLLAAVVVSRSVEAWGATEEEKFLGMFKKFGVSENSLTSKKPCLCVGGSFDGGAGRLALFKLNDRYHYECRMPFFNQQGDQMGSGSCVSAGGTVTVLSK